jgi:Uma2 family endonuclease
MTREEAEEIGSVERLVRTPGAERYEFVHGTAVEKPVDAESDGVGADLISFLSPYCRANKLGKVFGSQTGYRCFPHDRSLLRLPDVSFVAQGRLEGGRPPRGYFEIRPDLAVEVVSPNDRFSDVEEKVQDYLKAGVRLVWVIDPDNRVVFVRRPGGGVSIVDRTGTLSGEDVVPGFTLAVTDLFV